MVVKMYGVLAVPVSAHEPRGVGPLGGQGAMGGHDCNDVIAGRRGACAQSDSVGSALWGSTPLLRLQPSETRTPSVIHQSTEPPGQGTRNRRNPSGQTDGRVAERTRGSRPRRQPGQSIRHRHDVAWDRSPCRAVIIEDGAGAAG